MADLGISNISDVEGNLAHDDVDSGNPVKIGGKATTAAPTAVSSGDRVNAWFSPNGVLAVQLTSWSGIGLTFAGASDSMAEGDGGVNTNSRNSLFNGASWDRARSGGVTGMAGVAGADAADAAIAANPLTIGGRASTATPTAMTADGDVVNAWFTTRGAQNVRLVDDAGTALSVGGGTQYTEDAAITANAGIGNLMIGRRDDALSTLTPIEGDAVGLRVGNKGALWVQISDGSGAQITSFGGGTQYLEDVALGATGTPTGTLSMARGSTAVPTAVGTDGDAVSLWALKNGILNVRVVSSGGSIVDWSDTTLQYVEDTGLGPVGSAGDMGPLIQGRTSAAAPTSVSGDADAMSFWLSRFGALNVILRDTAGAAIATGTQYAEDVALAANAATGTLVVARRDDALSTLTPVADDAVGLRVGDKGALWVQISDGSGNQITSFGGGTQYVEDVALGAVGTATGALHIARASVAAPTAVNADADAVALWATRFGALNVVLRDTAGNFIANDAPTYNEDAALGAVGNAEGGLGMARASAAIPTAVNADADAVAVWALRSGQQVVTIADAAGDLIAVSTVGADGESNTHNVLEVESYGMLLNTAGTWDRLRSGPTADGQAVTGYAAAAGMLFNGSTWDRTKSVQGLSAAPNTDVGIAAVGVGPGYDRKTDPTGVAANSTASAVTVLVNGADVIVFTVTTIGTTPGSMIIEQTFDDSTWATSGSVLKLNGGTWIEGSFVPAVGDTYMVRTTGVRQVRYRVNAVYASGTATVKVTTSVGAAMVKAIDIGAAPHNIGYASVGVSATYSTTQTSATIGPTVSSTQRMVVTSVQIQAGGTTAGTCQVYFGTGAFSRGTSRPIFDGEFAPSATSKPGYAQSPYVPFIGAADEELKITTSANMTITVSIWYYLIAT